MKTKVKTCDSWQPYTKPNTIIDTKSDVGPAIFQNYTPNYHYCSYFNQSEEITENNRDKTYRDRDKILSGIKCSINCRPQQNPKHTYKNQYNILKL